MTKRFLALSVVLSAAFLHPGIAAAHSEAGTGDGLVSGLLHPLLGLDHLLAMVAVGLWGAQLGPPLVFALPIAFPMMMAVGAIAGIAGLPMVGMEVGIAASALVLGLVILFAFKAPIWLAILLVGAFAYFHGYAHGTELPHAASAMAYGIGFVVSTGLLHLAGIAIGLLNGAGIKGQRAVQGAGGIVAAAGCVFLAGALNLV